MTKPEEMLKDKPNDFFVGIRNALIISVIIWACIISGCNVIKDAIQEGKAQQGEVQ
jgi:hypothetical protein